MSDSQAPVNAYWFFSNLVIVHVSGDQTAGQFSLLEFLMPPGDMTPLHVHRHHTQTTYVLEGEVTFYLPGLTRVLRRGDCIHQPAGIAQTERVTSSGPARVLDINCPAGFERFVSAVGRRANQLTLPPADDEPPDLDRIIAVAATHGIDILGPPGTLP